jgi:hypothetical protein
MAKMKKASEMKLPALVGMVTEIEERYSDGLKADAHLRRMVGNMIRQVMEAQGFDLVRYSVPVKAKLFRNACLYRNG